MCLSTVYVFRYIKDTNIKNSAQDLNTHITKLAPDVMTWTPKPGSVLDLGLALRDSTNRLKKSPQTLCLCVCVFPHAWQWKRKQMVSSVRTFQLDKPNTGLHGFVFKQTVGFPTSFLLVIITLYHHHNEDTQVDRGWDKLSSQEFIQIIYTTSCCSH